MQLGHLIPTNENMKYMKYKNRKNNFRIRNKLLYFLDLIIFGTMYKQEKQWNFKVVSQNRELVEFAS